MVAVKSEEAMPFPLPETAEGRLSLLAEEPIRQRAASCDAVLIGCGLGRGRQTDALVRKLLDIDRPLVLDADGLNALDGCPEQLQRRTAPTVLTPHEGEFLRAGHQAMHEKGAMPWAFHEFWLRDMAFANSSRASDTWIWPDNAL